MKKGDFKLKAGDTWTTTITISNTKTRWLNKFELKNLLNETLKKYIQEKDQLRNQ